MEEFTPSTIRQLTEQYGSPLYLYSKKHLQGRARQLVQLSAPFGLTVRYAIKANPHPDVVDLLAKEGIDFDASSSYEADLLLGRGISGARISLSSQQPPHNLAKLLRAGVLFVATSMRQLEIFGNMAAPESEVGLRINTGFGSGHNNRTTTAGPSASFGLWHEYIDQALVYAKSRQLRITRLHTHIGSGADPRAWQQAIETSLSLAEQLPDVTSLDIGGGYKIKRYEGEQETDMQEIMNVFAAAITAFANKTGRSLHLEIEPGTWLVGHSGLLVAEIVDIVDTGSSGFTFLRTNTGMNDFMRPVLYGAQHDIQILNNSSTKSEYVVVGHNCESGDLLTPEPGNPENIRPRLLNTAAIGDLIAIADAGAYCASLRALGYNAFPAAREVLV
jgi:diaminopimelate decarboxylase